MSSDLFCPCTTDNSDVLPSKLLKQGAFSGTSTTIYSGHEVPANTGNIGTQRKFMRQPDVAFIRNKKAHSKYNYLSYHLPEWK
jgi:hypothetical protein